MNDDQWRLSVSNLVAAFVWFVVATMIALFRPELTVSRSAYAAGMVMGFFMLGMARGPAPGVAADRGGETPCSWSFR